MIILSNNKKIIYLRSFEEKCILEKKTNLKYFNIKNFEGHKKN